MLELGAAFCVVCGAIPAAVQASNVAGTSRPRQLFKRTVGDELLARAVALDDGLYQVLRHVGIAGQQLLGFFQQTVAVVVEARVVAVTTIEP